MQVLKSDRNDTIEVGLIIDDIRKLCLDVDNRIFHTCRDQGNKVAQ